MQTLESNPEVVSPQAGAHSMPSETTEQLKRMLRDAEIEAAQTKAKQYIAEGKFAEARKSLEEAESLSAEPRTAAGMTSRARFKKFVSGVESRMHRNSLEADEAQAATQIVEDRNANATALAETTVESALKTVDKYSKIAAGVGLLPTFVLNFAAVLAVEITMVRKIAKIFGRTDGKNQIRGSIMSLAGSVLPSTVGHGIGFAVAAAVPAVFAGTVLSFVLAPAIAYAITKAVGKVFIMHFESGGTLLTFDPSQFRDHFVREFKEAGGMSSAPLS